MPRRRKDGEHAVVDLFSDQERKRWSLAERNAWIDRNEPLVLFYFGPTRQKRLGGWSNEEESSLRAFLETHGWPQDKEEWGLISLRIEQRQRTGLQCKTYALFHLRDIPRWSMVLDQKEQLLDEAKLLISRWDQPVVVRQDNQDLGTQVIEIELVELPLIVRKIRALKPKTDDHKDQLYSGNITSDESSSDESEGSDVASTAEVLHSDARVNEDDVLRTVVRRTKPSTRLLEEIDIIETTAAVQADTALEGYNASEIPKVHHRRRLILPDDADSENVEIFHVEASRTSAGFSQQHDTDSIRSDGDDGDVRPVMTAQEIYNRVLKDVLEANLNQCLVLIDSHKKVMKRYELKFREVESRVYDLLKELRREYGADDPNADDKFLNGFEDERKSKQLAGVSASDIRELRGLSESDAKTRMSKLLTTAEKAILTLEAAKRRLYTSIANARQSATIDDALAEFDMESSDSNIEEMESRSEFDSNALDDAGSEASEALEVRRRSRSRLSDNSRKRPKISTNRSRGKRHEANHDAHGSHSKGNKRAVLLPACLKDDDDDNGMEASDDRLLTDNSSRTAQRLGRRHVAQRQRIQDDNGLFASKRGTGLQEEQPLRFPSNDLRITMQNESSEGEVFLNVSSGIEQSYVGPHHSSGLAAPHDALAGTSRATTVPTSSNIVKPSKSSLFSRNKNRRVVRGVFTTQTALKIGSGFMVPNLRDDSIGHNPVPPPLHRPGLVPASHLKDLFTANGGHGASTSVREVVGLDYNDDDDDDDDDVIGVAEMYVEGTDNEKTSNFDPEIEATSFEVRKSSASSKSAVLKENDEESCISKPPFASKLNNHPVVLVAEFRQNPSKGIFKEIDGNLFRVPCEIDDIRQLFRLAFRPIMLWIKSLTDLSERIYHLVRVMTWCIAADQPFAAFGVCFEAARKLLKSRVHNPSSFSASLVDCESYAFKAINETASAFGSNAWSAVNLALESYRNPIPIGDKLLTAAEEWQKASFLSIAAQDETEGNKSEESYKSQELDNFSGGVFSLALTKRAELRRAPSDSASIYPVDLSFIAASVSTTRRLSLIEWMEISFATLMLLKQLLCAPNWGFVFDSCLASIPWFQKDSSESSLAEWMALLRQESIDSTEYLKLIFSRINRLAHAWEFNKRHLPALSSALLRCQLPFALLSLFERIVAPPPTSNERAASRRAGEVLNDCFHSWALSDVTKIPVLIELLVIAARMFHEKDLPNQWPKITKKAIGMIRNISIDEWARHPDHFKAVLNSLKRLLEVAPRSKPASPSLAFLDGRSQACLTLGDLILFMLEASLGRTELQPHAVLCVSLLESVMTLDAKHETIDRIAELKLAAKLVADMFDSDEVVRNVMLHPSWLPLLQIIDSAAKIGASTNGSAFEATLKQPWIARMKSNIPRCLKECFKSVPSSTISAFEIVGRLASQTDVDQFIEILSGLQLLANAASYPSSSPLIFQALAAFLEAGLNVNQSISARIAKDTLGDILWTLWAFLPIKDLRSRFPALLRSCAFDEAQVGEADIHGLLTVRRSGLVTKLLDSIPLERLEMLDSLTEEYVLQRTRNEDLEPSADIIEFARWCIKGNLPLLSWSLLRGMVSSARMGCDRNPQRSELAAQLAIRCALLFSQGSLALTPGATARQAALIKHVVERNPNEMKIDRDAWHAFSAAMSETS